MNERHLVLLIKLIIRMYNDGFGDETILAEVKKFADTFLKAET